MCTCHVRGKKTASSVVCHPPETPSHAPATKTKAEPARLSRNGAPLGKVLQCRLCSRTLFCRLCSASGELHDLLVMIYTFFGPCHRAYLSLGAIYTESAKRRKSVAQKHTPQLVQNRQPHSPPFLQSIIELEECALPKKQRACQALVSKHVQHRKFEKEITVHATSRLEQK